MALSLGARLAQFARLIPNGPSPVVPFELIEQKTPVAAATTVDFTNLPAGFDRFILEIDGVGVQTDDSLIGIRVQTGGSTWQATGYSYAGRLYGVSAGADVSSSIDGYTTGIPLYRIGTANGVGNDVGEGLSAKVEFNAKDTANRRRFRYSSDYTRPDGADIGVAGVGAYGSAVAITGIRIYCGSTFKAQGNVKLIGIRA